MTDAASLLEAAERSIAASERVNAAAERLAAAIEGRAGNVQNVMLPQPLPPPTRAERTTWVAATAAIVALVVVYMQGQRVTDSLIAQQGLRQEVATAIAAERSSRERFETWAAEESNTMRTFARTGVLAPMKPRPTQQPEPKP